METLLGPLDKVEQWIVLPIPANEEKERIYSDMRMPL
jgi:hypothetical protein